ncbi:MULTISPECIES: V-type ATP synthase subunit I [Anaerococcus]|uniref:V-type ATP synthase subunit I n=2 Tax=Peptoniphilaceae TaxID=1570339 RepID=UPI00258D8014|nr:V-type ATPase 116kDa subunit family protein [Anaerococcus sp.]MDU1828424.1 V-type ATPase 116kDa subunit family protein [Anaerococcus sp.]MDU2565458.1 V-type ATPase 116kDa subunit family protein [Anaerococcus sp.]MDU3211177.1 V-type ATPase 116kDa subunit family protein [Anaerococcus sp.]
MADNQEFTQNDDIRLNNGEDYLLVYAKNVKKDINRTINSLGFIDNELPENIKEYDIESQIVENNEKLNAINQKIDDLKQRYNDVIDNLSYNLNFSKEASVYENSMAFGDKYFYFSAQVPESDLNVIEDLSKKYPNTKIASESKQVENNKKHKRKKDKKSSSGKENYLLVYPEKVKKDVSRSINTLGFVDKELPEDFVISKINEESKKTSDELSEINKQIDAINSQYEDVLGNLSYSLDYTKKSDQLKTKMAKGDDYFYLSGWVPESELKEFESLENEYKDTTVTTRDVETVNEQPPTRLKNNPLFRPFEYLVNMYGAPNYDEVDPTPFFAITYMLLYGLMFGDLGQGLVFLALGFYISKKNKTYGALLKRIGISASVFGLMYGSFFGKEDLIPALLIKPFDNVMTVLIASVVFGVSLMVISYIIGIYNKVSKQNNIEEGIFGKEGLAGLMMMISFIIIVLNLVNKSPIPMPIGTVMLILSIIMMVFKQPIARKITGSKRLYDSNKSDYYIESSFSIIEALLSVFSNLVSFTRVGAFAINHVGLYMAFEVMANLAGGFWGGVILLLGNLLIIGLEGMIVFIQGLRLEFYEMFSKYYEGNGRLFRPIRTKEN